MQEVHVVRNQHGHYWGKSKAWVDGRDPRAVARVKHHDEAVNLLFELSAKDIDLRGEVVAAPLGERGEPVLEISDVPLPTVEAQETAPATDTGNANAGSEVKASGSTTATE